MSQDARAVAGAARAPVDREETQVEQVGEDEREGQGDHVSDPVLACGEGRVDPGKERHPVALGAASQLGRGDLFLRWEGPLVDLQDFVGDRPVVGHGNLGEVCHGFMIPVACTRTFEQASRTRPGLGLRWNTGFSARFLRGESGADQGPRRENSRSSPELARLGLYVHSGTNGKDDACLS